MSDHTVLVMAAGEYSRWEGQEPKQLVDVGGMPLLTRTLRQLKGRDMAPTVVLRHPLIEAAVKRARAGARLYHPRHDRSVWLCKEVLECARLWSTTGTTVVLLGDVVYSNAALDLALAAVGADGWRFVGNRGEIFALSFRSGAQTVRECIGMGLQGAVQDASDAVAEKKPYGAVGKLWVLWRWLNGQPLREHAFKDGCGRRFVCLRPSDYTMDVDMQKDYKKLLRDVVNPGKLEDV